tara:strand:+ start:1477 stop:2337 length:861 start_codon:yes stop_codon:yes gene_type:complete
MPKYTSFTSTNIIQFRNNIIDFSTPKIMGILNLSTNSFYDGGKYRSQKEILSQCQRMINEGAEIIDIGAHSSKPGSIPIDEAKERDIILPAVKLIRNSFSKVVISIDTFRSSVARDSINNGADMINDISAGSLDKYMFETIAHLQVPYVIMHMQGVPENMQNNPQYENVMEQITGFLKRKLRKLKKLGAKNIIIDPGFGFGKTVNHNYKILNNLNDLRILDSPILVGLSRKSMIYKPLETSATNSLNGTSIAHSIAIKNGANILRVHDVLEAKECIKILNLAKNNL